jgi:hypothetical protein
LGCPVNFRQCEWVIFGRPLCLKPTRNLQTNNYTVTSSVTLKNHCRDVELMDAKFYIIATQPTINQPRLCGK